MSKSTSLKPDPDELLRTNSLSHKEIILRLDYIKELLSKEEIEFNDKQLIKLEKLIDKSRYNELDEEYDRLKEIPDQINYSNDEKALKMLETLSDKYLTKEEIELINPKIKEDANYTGHELKLRPPRQDLRESDNAKHLKGIVFNKTKLKKIPQYEYCFTLKYPSQDNHYNKSKTSFKLLLNIVDDKFKITFCETFKEDDQKKMKPEDYLFPEEIQMAMFEKLITQYPEMGEKLKTARKIDCIQRGVMNDNSLARISVYLDHIKDNPEDKIKIKETLSSSPNQSNTQNFMNQLRLKFNLKIDALPPKVLVSRLIKVANLKQTFTQVPN